MEAEKLQMVVNRLATAAGQLLPPEQAKALEASGTSSGGDDQAASLGLLSSLVSALEASYPAEGASAPPTPALAAVEVHVDVPTTKGTAAAKAEQATESPPPAAPAAATTEGPTTGKAPAESASAADQGEEASADTAAQKANTSGGCCTML
eukprot:m.33076 g.33076  ORF g.33076 m.33076 type:complete len:151 (+) comp10263_c0_seq1:260-712(+)